MPCKFLHGTVEILDTAIARSMHRVASVSTICRIHRLSFGLPTQLAKLWWEEPRQLCALCHRVASVSTICRRRLLVVLGCSWLFVMDCRGQVLCKYNASPTHSLIHARTWVLLVNICQCLANARTMPTKVDKIFYSRQSFAKVRIL